MNRRDLQFLQATQEYPSVSILVTLAQNMPARKSNEAKVKNAIAQAKATLLQEFSEQDIKPIITNLQALSSSVDYEHTTAQTLAFFANKDVREVYYIPVQLTDRMLIGSHFEVRDIVRALNRIPKYWVLAISEKPSRFFYGVHDALTEIIEPAQDAQGIDQDGFPYSYLPPNVDSLNDMYKASGRQMVSSGHTGTGRRVLPVHIDERDVTDHKKKFIERVFKLAERFLKPEPLPLFVVADDKNYGLLKQSDHNEQITGWVHGDYCKRTAHDIAQVVWPEVKKYLEEERQKKIKEFTEEAMGTKKHAFGMDDVWRAAQEGRIKDLLVEENLVVHGLVDPDNKFHILRAEGNELPQTDLVNELVDTVLNKGEKTSVTFVEPGALKKYGQVAAILRY